MGAVRQQQMNQTLRYRHAQMKLDGGDRMSGGSRADLEGMSGSGAKRTFACTQISAKCQTRTSRTKPKSRCDANRGSPEPLSALLTGRCLASRPQFYLPELLAPRAISKQVSSST